ncbi:MAG: Asp-tRNA(Asn)/Glu-tRNA(Gln) amidotransferase subunit GatA [Candidatus Fibromonas sp.]|jgi:aspartyl-tRNA(Asn)/glutamyl-tRNA(Gln) amidotransferase subunit A|nr:Asp-tRNA(Asn)/Glu-tRNA(Gln) amidotransferase subunit GatA [Candidatus Fibromonas sp.]
MNLEQVLKEIESSSAAAVAERTFDRIEKARELNAYLSVCRERALKQAQAADERRKNGKALSALDGVPIAVKDNMCIEGTKTTCASRILENFVSPYTATAIAKLEAAGAVVIGKTNMDEFAMGSSNETSYFGKVINPRAKDRVPGGSSGGSAVAVASETVALALGSDTGGSIRQPAACTGTVGIKPTYGRVSRYGLVAYASSLDQIGAFSSSVKDLAPVLNFICGQDPKDNTTSSRPAANFGEHLGKGVKGKVIGLPKEYYAEGLDPKCREVIETALGKLEKEGAVLKEVSLPSIRYAIESYYIIAPAEASSNLSRFDGIRYTHRSKEAKNLMDTFSMSRGEGFGSEVKLRILLGNYVLSSGFYDAYYVQAQKVRRIITEDFNKAFSVCDVIASPAMPGLPQLLGVCENDHLSMVLSDLYTVSVNLADLPGLVQPCGNLDGIPVGLQWIGKPFDEASLLGIGDAFEGLI